MARRFCLKTNTDDTWHAACIVTLRKPSADHNELNSGARNMSALTPDNTAADSTVTGSDRALNDRTVSSVESLVQRMDRIQQNELRH